MSTFKFVLKTKRDKYNVVVGEDEIQVVSYKPKRTKIYPIDTTLVVIFDEIKEYDLNGRVCVGI